MQTKPNYGLNEFPDQSRCIFCKIVAGKTPATILYEDDTLIVFLNRYKRSSVGPDCLVIPKEHYTYSWEIPAELLSPLLQMTQYVSKALMEATAARGTRIWISSGRQAGQTIGHVHFHVYPCYTPWDLLYYFRGMTPFSRWIRNYFHMSSKPSKTQALEKMAAPIRKRLQEIMQNA